MAMTAAVRQEVISLDIPGSRVGQPAGGLGRAGEKGRLGVGEGCSHDHVASTRRSGRQDPPTALGARGGSR